MSEFTVEVRPRGVTTVLELHGDINGAAEGALTSAYEAAAITSPTSILLNFERVEYINSTGIALIVGLLADARKEGRAVLVCGLTEHFRHIFEITRLADFMSFYPDEDAAVGGQVISLPEHA